MSRHNRTRKTLHKLGLTRRQLAKYRGVPLAMTPRLSPAEIREAKEHIRAMTAPARTHLQGGLSR